MSSLSADEHAATRQIAYRTSGRGTGPIIRLMSPSDYGALVKPFVFLDRFSGDSTMIEHMPLHPHSGIATVTVLTAGDLRFDDPDAGQGTIGYGGVEWMRAGGGVWHGKEMSAGDSARVEGFQLWLALPPALENGPVDSQYLEAPSVPQTGPARVILGEYNGARSPVRSPEGINYLLVTLPARTVWHYIPPENHTCLWLSLSQGTLHTPDAVAKGEMVIFSAGTEPVTLQAGEEETRFVIGSAVDHPWPLSLGNYSVHTSEAALRAGEAKIKEIGHRLREEMRGKPQSGSLPVYQ